MKSGITTAPTKYFHGHTNLFHELTSVDCTQSNEGSWDVTVFLQVPFIVQAQHFQCWCEMKSDQTTVLIECFHGRACLLSLQGSLAVVSSGGAPTPAGTSVFTKHNWDMGMGYLWLNGWGIYHLMGGAFMA